MQFTLLEIAAPFSGRVLSFSTTRVALHHSLGSGDTRCRDKGHRGASEIRWDPAQPATLRWPLATRSRAGSRTGTDQGGEFCGIFGAPVLKRSQVAIRLGLQIGPTLELAKGLGPLVVNRSRSGALLEDPMPVPRGRSSWAFSRFRGPRRARAVCWLLSSPKEKESPLGWWENRSGYSPFPEVQLSIQSKQGLMWVCMFQPVSMQLM